MISPALVSGITCKSPTICLDDVSRYEEAKALYDKAFQFVTSSVWDISNKPRIIFCATESCFSSFGFRDAAAKTVGTLGIVIGPRGWKYYYIRHEMIHHVQAEQLGIIAQWRSPVWFKEGMAYFLSQDPRKTLSQPNQAYRERFARWYKTIDRKTLWEAAQKISKRGF